MYLFINHASIWSNLHASVRRMATNKYLKNRKIAYKLHVPNVKKKYILYNKHLNRVFCSPFHKQPINYKEAFNNKSDCDKKE
jgi:hypothetical protein